MRIELVSGIILDVIKDIQKEPGIYIIYNEKTKLVYVGQSTDCYRRMNHHFNQLRKNSKRRFDGRITKFQKSFNEDGEKVFKRYILEYCPLKSLTEREDYWIKKLNSYENKFGYNITKEYNATYGMLGKKHKRETIEIFRKVNKKENNPMYGKKLSHDHRRKIGDHFRGIKLEEEHKKKIGEGNRKFKDIKIYFEGNYITTKRTIKEARDFVVEKYGYKPTERNLRAKIKNKELYRNKLFFECDL